MERPQLVATRRTVHGTRAARRMRKTGLIPGVVYGKATSPTPIVVNRRDLVRLLHVRAGQHSLVTLRLEADPTLVEHSAGAQGGRKGGAGGTWSPPGKPGARVEGSKSWEKPVLIKHVEHDPVHGEIIHVDLHAIALTEQIRIKIPIVLKGEPIGVKQEGGVLEHFLREMEVECLPTEIPKQVEHDVSLLKIGDTIHVRELTPPAGVRITTDPESAIASVLTPKEEKVEEVAEAITEPEVIREKKPEAEAEAAEGKEEKKAEKKDEKKEEK